MLSLGLPANGQSSEPSALAAEIRAAILTGGAGVTQAQLGRLDVNGDGAIDVADLVALSGAPTIVSFETGETVANEAQGSVVVKLRASTALSGVPILFTFGGSASPGADYQAPTPGSVVMNGESATLVLPIVDDLPYEGTERIQISLLPTQHYFPGPVATHVVVLEESTRATEAEYLFNLVRDLPGGISMGEAARAMLSRTVSVSLTYAGSRVVGARLNEARSIGFADDDRNIDRISASRVAHSGGRLEIDFRFQARAGGFTNAPTLRSFTFNPESMRLDSRVPSPSPAEQTPILHTLQLLIENFVVSPGRLPQGGIEGTFRMTLEGLLREQSDQLTSGKLIGSIQPLGVSR